MVDSYDYLVGFPKRLDHNTWYARKIWKSFWIKDASLKNTLKHNNLWLASDEISANTFDDIGFVEDSNPVYTNCKDMEIVIEKAISELVKKDKDAAEIYAKLKGTKFITCTSKRVHGIKAVTEAIAIRTTNNNYGRLLQLLGRIPEKIGSQYVICS